MKVAARLRSFVSALVHRSRLGGEIDEELRAHIQDRAAHLERSGLSRVEAERRARLEFGGCEKFKEECREARGTRFIESFLQDIRYAFRGLARNRAFTAVAIATLGLGIGASTAIFSVIDNVLLAPFPYKDAGRIVFPRIHDTTKTAEEGRQGYSSDELLEFARENHVFDAVVATTDDLVLYKHGNGVDWLYGADVTPGAFEFFGMPSLYGRGLQPGDYRPGAPPVFVMGYKTWKERFNGDAGVLNKTFVLDGVPRTLVGIMPPRFSWYGAELWIPKTALPGASTYWFMVGWLKPGVSRSQAAADLTIIATHLAKLYPQDYPPHFQVLIRNLGSGVVQGIESTLYTVLAAVGLLLLIGCANVANLTLARATSREKEFALRAVLGATAGRLVRLLLTESVVVAIGGATLGLLIAWGGLKLMVATMPPDLIPSESVIGLNPVVLAFAVALAILTPLIFGLAPALQSARRDLNDPLRESGRGASGGFRTGRMRDALVIVEVAVSLILLIGAGLLMRSFVALCQVNLGLRADHVLAAGLLMPPDRYKTTTQVSSFVQPLLARVKALPGVVDAAESSALPPDRGGDSKIEISGTLPHEAWHAQVQSVSDGYFRVLRIPFIMGRSFSQTEINDTRKLAIVNQTFVSTYLHGEDPIGRRVTLLRLKRLQDPVRDPWFEIVGVVTDVANQGPPQFGGGGLRAPVEPEVWVPYTVTGSGQQILVLRAEQIPTALTHDVQQAVWATDSGVAMVGAGALEDGIREQLYAGPQFALVLMIIFGCMGLILVVVGVYSVLAYATAQRTHEIGIRMALGAERADVLRLVIGRGLRLVAAGVAIGLIVSLSVGRVIQAELWPGVKPYDPATLASMAILLTLVALFACYIPARRAMRVDPMVALRYE
jgi:putative ABC transport system permease protein